MLILLFAYRTLFFQPSLLTSVKTEVPFENSRPLVFAVLILISVLSGVDALFSSFGKNAGKKRSFSSEPAAAAFSVIGLAANAALSFGIVELINNYYILQMKTRYVLLGIGVTAVFYLFAVLALNSATWGMVVGNWFFFAWGAANYFVQQFRGIPLQWVDFSSFGTAMSVAGNYEYVPNWQIVAACVITCAVSGLWMRAAVSHNFRSIAMKLISRGAASVIAAVFVLVIFKSDFLADQGIWLRDWQPWYTYRLFGMEAGFLAFARASYPEAPKSYSEERVAEIISEAEAAGETAESGGAAGGGKSDSAVSGTADQTDEGTAPENIICIMNESFSDLTIYPNFESNVSLLDHVNSLKENTQSGTLLVSVKGGTTANTEYEFLTGNSCVLSPTTVVYNSFIKQDQYSLVKVLESQGYTSLAMHPYGQYGWNRNTVYPKMGFDTFLNTSNYYTDAEKVRGFVSDQADYQAIIDQVESKPEGEKLFIFNITMQNHSSYKTENFTSTVDIEGFSGSNEGQAEQYCTLIKMSDEAIGSLIDYFSKSDEKTIICFFGDHQPEIGDDFWQYCFGKDLDDLSFEEQQLMYETRWFIWANYDIPEQENVTISANYLGSYLLSAAGLDMSDYEEYLLNSRELIPAMNAYGYLGTDGQQHEWGSDSSGEAEEAMLEDYKCLIYNELTGGNRRDSGFFGLDGGTLSP